MCKKYLCITIYSLVFICSCGADVKPRYVKLDRYGNALEIQSMEWNSIGTEETGEKWSCVLDNTTNLIWEIKTDDGGANDFHHLYTWFDPNSPDGDPGWYDRGYCPDYIQCDTYGYVEYINSVSLCGATDWRMPLIVYDETFNQLSNELISINDTSLDSYPKINSHFFPSVNKTGDGMYWVGTPVPSAPLFANTVQTWTGEPMGALKSARRLIRLVRDNK